MAAVTDFLYMIDDFLWGTWMTILLVGIGVVLSIRFAFRYQRKIVFNFKNSDTDLLKNATNTQGIAINWYVSQSQIQDFINKINNYCNTTLTLSEWQTLDNYNAIVDALNQSSAPNHFSGTTQPKLTKKSEDDYIKAQDLLDLENAFNNRKFI